MKESTSINICGLTTEEISKICMSCGACCHYYPTININKISEEEWGLVQNHEKLPKKFYQIIGRPKVIDHPPNSKFLLSKPYKETEKVCVALEGEILKNVSCSAYQNRPKTCTDFKVGSFRCNKIREKYGLPILYED